jgi:hypothetical protein
MVAAEEDVQEKRGENHRLTAHDAWGLPWLPPAQRSTWVLGSRLDAGWWLGEAGTFTGSKQELLNNKP